MMLLSNIFLLLPAIFAALYQEWLYFFLATGLCIFSPLYHWYQIYKPHTLQYRVFAKLDLIFAVSAFLYMYYWVYMYGEYKLFFHVLLSLIVMFFLFGRHFDYERFHPWFHILAPILSSAILIVAYV